MKFIISRASEEYGEVQPIAEAKRMLFEQWQTRSISEAEFNRKFSKQEGTWRSKGKNHFVTKEGYICRQEEDREFWGVEVSSLKGLLALQRKYGGLVIDSDLNSKWDTGLPTKIEIYDDPIE